MKSIDNYNDLCIDIETQEIIINEIEKEKKQIKRLLDGPKDLIGLDYSREPGGQRICIPLDKVIDRIERVEKRLDIEKEILKSKLEARRKIDEKLKKLDGLDSKVAYMRDIQKKSLQEISDKLGYSYNWISKVSSKIGKNKAKCS